MSHLSNFHCNFLISRHLICNLNLIYIYPHFNLQFNTQNYLMNYQLHIYFINKSCFCNHPHYRIASHHLNFHCTNYFNKIQRNISHLYYINHRFKLELYYIGFLMWTLRIFFKNKFNLRNLHVPYKILHFLNFHYKVYLYINLINIKCYWNSFLHLLF